MARRGSSGKKKRSKGEVRWYDPATGRGLIASDDGGTLLSVRRRSVAGGQPLAAGDAVEFRVSVLDGIKTAVDVSPAPIEISSDEEEGEVEVVTEDECCILDFDPFRPVTATDLANELKFSQLKDQEISVIAERGEVACRDFPHSRHLCAKFPFSKTTHESCCLQCYCYVCDVLAPCKYWNGIFGHCHASDLDKRWKDQRRVQRFASAARVPAN